MAQAAGLELIINVDSFTHAITYFATLSDIKEKPFWVAFGEFADIRGLDPLLDSTLLRFVVFARFKKVWDGSEWVDAVKEETPQG